MNGTATPIEAEGLGIRYGSRQVLESINFQLQPGQVMALLGRNAAGKSSLLRCLLGWQKPSAGSARLWGGEAWKVRSGVMARVGVVQEFPDAPAGTVGDVTRFCSRLQERWNAQVVAASLERAGIVPEDRTERLSRGQKTQLALALALGHGPELLVLDDPALGLDAVSRRAFQESLVSELAERPFSVLLATHDLAGAEGLADRVGLLAEAGLVADEPLDALKARMRRVRWGAGMEKPSGLAALGLLREETSELGGGAVVERFDEAIFSSLQAGQPGMVAEPLSLEDAFIALVDGRKEVRA